MDKNLSTDWLEKKKKRYFEYNSTVRGSELACGI